MSKPKGVNTKLKYVQAGAYALVQKLKGAGCVISNDSTIVVPVNVLGIYLLGAIDYLVTRCEYTVRFTRIKPPAELAYTTSVRTLLQASLRRKATQARKVVHA